MCKIFTRFAEKKIAPGVCKLIRWIILFLYMFTYYARKCVVFWQNLRSWQKIYTPAGHGAHDKFQLCQQDDCHKEHHQQDHHHGRHDLQKNNKINTGKEATTKKITMFKTWDSNLLCRCSIDQTEMMILPPTRKTWGVRSPLRFKTVSVESWQWEQD